MGNKPVKCDGCGYSSVVGLRLTWNALGDFDIKLKNDGVGIRHWDKYFCSGACLARWARDCYAT